MFEKISEIMSPGTAPLRTFLTVFALVFLLVFGAAAVITFLMPETYAATVRIKVERNTVVPLSQSGSTPSTIVYDPYFIQTEFEILQSEAVLGRVIEALNLNAQWGKRYAGNNIPLKTSETSKLLKKRLNLRTVRGTSLIEIRVFGENPDEPAVIANAIAQTYRDYCMERDRQLAQSTVKTLETRFSEEEQKVREAQQVVDRLRKELGISESDAAGNAPAPTLGPDSGRQLQIQLIASQTALAREQAQFAQLERLAPDQRRDALQTVVGPDAELGDLLAERNLAQQRLLALQKDYDPGSTVYLSAKTMVDEAAKRINVRVEGIMVGLRSRVSVQEAAAEALKDALEKARNADNEKAERSRPFYAAKAQLEELLRLRSVLNMKFAGEQISGVLPKAALAEIIDRASPSRQSVRPNKPKNLFFGAVAGFVLGTLIGAAAASGSSFWARRKAAGQPAALC